MSNQSSYILGPNGDPVSSEMFKGVPNLDRNFFIPQYSGGQISAEQIHEKPYQYHVWTYACARTIALNISRLRKTITERKTGEEITNHPIIDLLEIPNEMMDEFSFWQTTVLILLLKAGGGKAYGVNRSLLGGQCFVIPWNLQRDDKVNLANGEIPTALFPFTDSLFKARVKKNERGMADVDGWDFIDPKTGKTVIEFDNNEIIKIRLVNPYDLLAGMAPQVAAQVAIDNDAKSDVYNSRLFDNDARVAGVLSTDQMLDRKQAKETLLQWMERYGGPANAGKVAVLGNGLKYQQIGMTQADMQYIEQKEYDKERILAAFGLNKIAIGDYEDINFATIKEGRKMLWQDTYQPIDKMILASFNTQWLRYVDNGAYRLSSAYNEIEALQEDQKPRAQAMGDYVQRSLLPPVVAARIVGVELTDQEIADYPHLSEAPKQQQPAQPQPEKSAVKKDVNKKTHTDDVIITEDELELAWAKYAEYVLDPAQKSFGSIMQRFFVSQRNAMQDKVDEWLKTQKAAQFERKSVIVDPKIFLLGLTEETERLLELYTPQALQQMKLEQQRLEDELGGLISWGVTDDRLKNFVGKRREYLAGINALTFKNVLAEVTKDVNDALEENLAPRELAKKIKTTIHSTMQPRINHHMTIARTEMGSIASMSRFDAFNEEGVEKTQWSTAMDEKVRGPEHSHKALQGITAPIGSTFKRRSGPNRETNMRYPRDSHGAASDVINCRCVALAYIED